MTDVVQSMQDIFAAVTQELTVILVFFLSLALWRHVGQRNKANKQWKTLPPKPSVTQKKAGLEHHEKPIDGKVLQAIQAAEVQMLQLLEQREFTRALNFFRTFERDGRDKHFSEALFSAFIQSSIRVGKIDVVERLVRSMKRHGTTPSREFWRTTLKMLSSRKHYDACLAIYTTLGRALPSDKVVFSCLINGALESGAADKAAGMLDRYREADLDPRDHVLLFRTYVAITDVESAEKVFKSLGENMSSLMLNLLLLTCVQS